MGTTLMDTPLLILCMAAKREPLMLKFITLPTEYCLLDTLDTTIPTHTFCTDVRREKLMLMLLHGTEFMDTGLLDILVTTILMDIPSLILCMAARKDPLKPSQNHLLNPMLILKLMLMH